MRLDKFISNFTLYSRSEVKKLVKEGFVEINDEVAKKPNVNLNPEVDVVKLGGEVIAYEPFVYYILHKPAGYISSTSQGAEPLVTDLLDPEVVDIYDPHPVGRLDKDTEGLLLLTNDGQFTHRALSPKKHVEKEYYAEIDGIITPRHQERFAAGITIDGNEKCAPAQLFIDAVDEVHGTSQVRVIITEGKFHQVKRMFQALGTEVTYLKRLRMGGLKLPEFLAKGSTLKVSQEYLFEQVFGKNTN